jgi:hypothetical protein
MNTHADKTQENKSQSVANAFSQKSSSSESTFQFVDNRPEAVTQRKLQEMANNSPQVSQLRAIQEMANNSPQAKQTAQLQAMADNYTAQKQQPIQKKENNTGLPDNLKTGMENLSGMSLDDVKVHRNSDKPAQLQAHAYAQGSDIHLASGQEKHLPHEAWHVVQQKQGRVKPTMQMKGKVNINDDVGLEKEADVMGVKAMNNNHDAVNTDRLCVTTSQLSESMAVQRRVVPVQIVWGRTHLVKEVGESILGEDPLDEFEADELIANDIVTINDEDVFVSRRGPNQEDVENRETDKRKFPSKEWYRVIEIERGNVESENLYIRNGTFVPSDDDRSLAERVRAALTISLKDLSKDSIMASLETHFHNFPGGLFEATKRPEFSAILLEEIRIKQSNNWAEATQIHDVDPVEWTNDELQYWTVRHYTNKAILTLGEQIGATDDGANYYKISGVKAPSFTEVLSSATLAALPSSGGEAVAHRTGSEIMMANSSGSSTSGHTTATDWVNIGNVGDTFYGLFYKGEPANGIVPSFIRDAVYYAEWSAEAFGVGWASADWLSTAKDSRKEDGATPDGIARGGKLSDVIADIYPEAATRVSETGGGRETGPTANERKSQFAEMGNFEIKKHGPMTIGAWITSEGNAAKLGNYYIKVSRDGTVKMIKMKRLLPAEIRDNA